MSVFDDIKGGLNKLKNLDRRFQEILTKASGGRYNLETMRTVEWGRRYLWTIKFTGNIPSGSSPAAASAPSPFGKDWFPASDVEFPVATLESFNVEKEQSAYRIPQRGNIKTLSITFFDTEDGALLKWIRDWIEYDILNGGHFVSCLRDTHTPPNDIRDSEGVSRKVAPVREVEIAQLKPDYNSIGSLNKFFIYPEGEINFVGGSSSEANVYTVNFVIVGDDLKYKKGKKNKKALKEETALQVGARLLSRFL